jgi:hypothetical protein
LKRPSGKQVFRGLLCLSCLIGAVICLYLAWEDKSRIPPLDRIEAIPYRDLVKAAIDANLAQSTGLFDVGLLLLGALWGLVIAKKDEGRITAGDFPELIMFLCASGLLLLSFLWHDYYLENLAGAYDLASRNCVQANMACFPDVLGVPNVEYLRNYQQIFLVLGGGIALVTIVSAHHLKE